MAIFARENTHFEQVTETVTDNGVCKAGPNLFIINVVLA